MTEKEAKENEGQAGLGEDEPLAKLEQNSHHKTRLRAVHSMPTLDASNRRRLTPRLKKTWRGRCGRRRLETARRFCRKGGERKRDSELPEGNREDTGGTEIE